MNKKLTCIMLVDDDPDDNYFHERAIKQNDAENIIITKNTGGQALAYLKSTPAGDVHPDLIFLDINMPGMDGWEFLQEYDQLDKSLQNKAIIIMLTTSGNPDDKIRAKKWNFVSDFITKPLTKEHMKEICDKYFS